FQAEDGIRDFHVTGVQTCALPILSNSLVLPHVLRFNAPDAAGLYAELAELIVPDSSGSAEARSQALIAHLEALIHTTGIERRLREVGVQETDLSRLASDAMKQTRLLGNNPREVREEDAYAIYAAAY